MTFHIVRMNEKIEKIALNYQLEIDEIKEHNKFIKDWNHLIPGTKLRLPEISTALNEELDNEEPFIEEYYPKLNYHEFEPIGKEKQVAEEEISAVSKAENNQKKQEIVLPNNNYPPTNKNYNSNYYYYFNPYVQMQNQRFRNHKK